MSHVSKRNLICILILLTQGWRVTEHAQFRSSVCKPRLSCSEKGNHRVKCQQWDRARKTKAVLSQRKN